MKMVRNNENRFYIVYILFVLLYVSCHVYAAKIDIKENKTYYLNNGDTAFFDCDHLNTITQYGSILNYSRGELNLETIKNGASFECNQEYIDAAKTFSDEYHVQHKNRLYGKVTEPFYCNSADVKTQIFCLLEDVATSSNGSTSTTTSMSTQNSVNSSTTSMEAQGSINNSTSTTTHNPPHMISSYTTTPATIESSNSYSNIVNHFFVVLGILSAAFMC